MGVSAVAGALLIGLLTNIFQRKQEARTQFVRLVEVTEDDVDPAKWGVNWAREYDGYLRTAEPTSTKYGGGMAGPEGLLPPQKAERDPWLTKIFAGYLFAVDYRDRPLTVLGVLTGSIMLLADLIRQLDLPLRVGLIQASSYRGPTTKPGELRLGPELLPDIRDHHVLLLDDILDTGQTLRHLVEHLRELEPLSIKVAVLLRKQGRQRFEVTADFIGFEIPNEFVVGYGLDYNDEYRYLPHVAVLPSEQGVPHERVG